MTDTANNPPKGMSRPRKLALIGGAFLVILIVAPMLFAGLGGARKGLAVSDILVRGSEVNFRLTNTSSQSGDVLVSISVNGTVACRRVLRMSARTQARKVTSCRSIRRGDHVGLSPMWARYAADLAVQARRIQ